MVRFMDFGHPQPRVPVVPFSPLFVGEGSLLK